jgi:hypothetical protein
MTKKICIFFVLILFFESVFSQKIEIDTISLEHQREFREKIETADSLFNLVLAGKLDKIFNSDQLKCFFSINKIKSDLHWFTNLETSYDDYEKTLTVRKKISKNNSFSNIDELNVNYLNKNTQDELIVSFWELGFCLEVLKYNRDKGLVIPSNN